MDLNDMVIISSNEKAKAIGADVGIKCFDAWRNNKKKCPWCPPIGKWKEMEQQKSIIKADNRTFELYWIRTKEDLSLHLFFDITDEMESELKLHNELMINSSINNILKKIIGKRLKVKEVTDLILNFARFISSSSEGFISIRKNSNEEIYPISWTGIFDEVFKRNEPTNGITIRGISNKEDITEIIMGDKEVFLKNSPLKTLIDTGSSSSLKLFRNQLGIPVVYEDNIKGMIYLADSEKGYTDNIKKVVDEFALILGILLRDSDIQYKLMETTNRYRMLFNDAFDMIHIVDKKGRIIDANKIELEKMGYRRDEYIGRRLLDFIHPDFKEETRNALRKVLSGEGIKGYTTTMVNKDGNEIIVEVNATPKWKEGKVVEAAGIFRDITEKIHSLKEIRRSQEFLTTLLDTIPIPVFYKNKEGYYLGVNKAFETFFGGCREDIIGKSVFDINPSDLAKEYHKNDLKLLKKGGIQQYESKAKNWKGEVRNVQFNKAAFLDSEGSIKGLIGTVIDITENIRVEEQIRATNVFLDMVIDMSPFAMWVSDENGTVIRTNRSLVETINLSEENIIGKYNVLKDKNLENQGVMDKVKAVFENHEPARFGIFWKSSEVDGVDFTGGRDMFIDVSLFPIVGTDGRTKNVVCQWVDITNQKKLEEEREKILHDMGERLKELKCMQRISEVIRDNDNKDNALAEICNIVPEGWQYPNIARCRIRVCNKSYTSENFEESEWKLSDNIIVDREKIGSIDIFYLEKRPDMDEGPFLKEERNLLRYISEAIGLFLKQERSLRYLIESEERFRGTFEQAAVGIAHVDTDGRFIRINEKFCLIVGYDHDQMIGKTFQEITYPDDLEIDIDNVNRLLGGEIETYNMEKRYIRKDETIVWVNLTVSLMRKEKGDPDYFISVVEDISKRKSIENEALSLGYVISEASESIVSTDLDGFITSWNKGAEKLHGYTQSEILGERIDLIFPEDRKSFFFDMIKELNRTDRISLEIPMVRKNGEEFHSHISFTALRDVKGRITGTLGFALDITERINAEKQIKGEKENAEFYLDLLNHDMGNIHQGIHSSLQLMEHYIPEDKKELSRILEVAMESLYKSISLTNEVKMFSKMRSHRVKLEYVDLKKAIEKAIDDVKKTFPEKEIEFDLDLFDYRILAESIVSQVFYNLFHNAIKLQGSKSWIGVEMVQLPEGIRIFISDKGPGITDSQKNLVFSKKRRNFETGFRTGIGLLIVKELVERYGGKIEVGDRIKDDSSSGAKFFIEFKESGKSDSFMKERSRISDDTMPELQQ